MIDTHIHLDDPRYDGEREEIIDSFALDGIDFVINNSADFLGMVKGFEIAQKHKKVYCTVGCHPHDAKTFSDAFENKMVELANNPKVVAVGEVGLDYFYELSERKVQKEVFARQIMLAHKLNLPLTLHLRDAFADALDILQAHRNYLDRGILLHCYSGSAETAKTLLNKYLSYFAFGGALTFKKNRKSEVLSAIPLDRVLTETDGPYLTPEPFRGKLNYPKYIRLVLPHIAAAYGIDFSQAEATVLENTKRFFTKIK